MHYQVDPNPAREVSYFFIDENCLCGREILFSVEESRHIAKSLRMGVGEIVTASDGNGTLYRVKITSVKQRVLGLIVGERKEEPERHEIILAVGLSRSESMKWAVEKATELGVRQVIPLVTGRSRRVRGTEQQRKLVERLRRVAVSALKQSKRAFIPLIHMPVELNDFLDGCDRGALCLLLDEELSRPSITEVLRKSKEHRFTVMIGPEGGFREDEKGRAISAGFRSAGLGPARLRVETAAIAVIVAIRCLHGFW
ncbi:MAG: RsmE family RNA methyltransferase [Candidatus Glassbacteria bacterium]